MIAILTGGLSDERDIALKSADNIRGMVERAGFETRTFVLPEQLDEFLLARHVVQCAVPVFHGPWGEDGVIQGFLETLRIPYLFSGVEAQALGMDKRRTKILLAAQGMPIAQDMLVKRGEVWPDFPQPVVVKPVASGSSFNVHLCRTAEEYEKAREACMPLCVDFMIEELCAGDEYSVAVIDRNGQSLALPVIAIKPKTDFFNVEAKYDPTKCEEICPAPIGDELADGLKKLALLAHAGIGARHLSRSDFIVNRGGDMTFLEINTIPGSTETSLLPKTLATAGIDASALFKEWIDAAIA